MKGNNDIFLVGDDALEYLTRNEQKIFHGIIWDRPFSTCGYYDQFFDSSHIPPCACMYAFRLPPPFAYVISSI